MSGGNLKKITIRNASLANGKRHVAGLVRLFLQENTRGGVEGVAEFVTDRVTNWRDP